MAMLLLCACGAKELSAADTASYIVSQCEFSEQLNEISPEITIKRYGLDADIIEECAAYSATNAVVDEVAVFKSSDAEAVMEGVEKHIVSQKELYASYAPDEVKKLDDAVIKVVGDCIILCVSPDASGTEGIISEYIK